MCSICQYYSRRYTYVYKVATTTTNPLTTLNHAHIKLVFLPQIYKERVSDNSVLLSGPTLFAPLITQASQIAAANHCRYVCMYTFVCVVQFVFVIFLIEFNDIIHDFLNYSQAQQKYTILLILTDGEIMDMPQTQQAVANASNQPLSIVIVGVGAENFGNMHILDNNVPGSSRDIVQFVPYVFRYYLALLLYIILIESSIV